MDITGQHKNKTPFSDHQEGNQTYLLLYALEHASKDEKATLLKTRGKSLDQKTIETLRSIFEKTGSVDYAKKEINTLLDRSTKKLDKLLDNKNRYKKKIQFVIDYLRM